MLRRNANSSLRVFVVWEPVLPTDWARPSASITSNVADSRASHFWDAQHRLSTLYGGRGNLKNIAMSSDIGFKMTGVIWDAAVVYPPGVRWGSRADRLIAPVYRYADSLVRGGG